MKSVQTGLVAVAAVLAVVGAVFAFSVQSSYANSIINGSFEDTSQANGSWSIYANLPGWTGGPGWTGNAGDPGGIELRNNVAGTAYDGSNFIELDVYHNSLASQTIGTAPAQTYNLSFAYAPRENVSADSNGIEVFWNSVSLGTYTGDGFVSSAWTVYSLSVTGTGADTLTFKAVGIDDSVGGSLDAVSLTATPIPSTWLMLLSGFVGLGFFAYRGTKKNSAAIAAI